MTGDLQMHWPVSASRAQMRPSPAFEVGSGAPKTTARECPGTPLTMAALEAIPGPDGFPLPVAMSSDWVVTPQESGAAAVAGGDHPFPYQFQVRGGQWRVESQS